jgi:hypothetical protein
LSAESAARQHEQQGHGGEQKRGFEYVAHKCLGVFLSVLLDVSGGGSAQDPVPGSQFSVKHS